MGPFWGVFEPLKWAEFGYLVDQGVFRGSDLGSFQLFWTPPYTIPIRARAYNDCAKHTILLKTRSSGGPGYPRIERVFGTLQMVHQIPVPGSPRIYLHSGMCANMCYIIPQNGPILGYIPAGTSDHGSSPDLGGFGDILRVDPGDYGIDYHGSYRILEAQFVGLGQLGRRNAWGGRVCLYIRNV